MPPGRSPKVKDMKVYPEPDDLSSCGQGTPRGTRLYTSDNSAFLTPRDDLQNPEVRLRGSERLSPKPRTGSKVVEDLDLLSDGGFMDRSVSRTSGRPSAISYEEMLLSSRQTPRRSGRPSAMLNAQHMGRKAVHAGGSSTGLAEMHRAMWRANVAKVIGRFVDCRFMLISSVCITIYALIGDDIRLLCTNRPADPWFNAIAVVTLLFFTVEIILSSIGKPDYFLGFFFFLDLVATLSIVLDLTWVSEALIHQDNVDMGSNARSGRTARVGATVGRVVRVLRLMRIVKLYRAYFEQMTRKKTTRNFDANMVMVPGSSEMDGWENEDLEEAEKAQDAKRQESAVGKKLVSLSTRRVIMMVLVMLLVLPQLRIEMSDVSSTSTAWGADSVWQAFRQFEQNAALHSRYEDTLLRYLYFHNWFEARRACASNQGCPSNSWTQAYWVGFAGRDVSLLRQKAQQARVSEGARVRWDRASSDKTLLYNTGTMPPQASARLSGPWTTLCVYGGLDHLGTSLLETEIEGHVDHAVECPSDLRPAESVRVHPQVLTKAQFDDWHLVFFFDMRPFTREESFLALLSTAFICVVLCIGTLFFSRDANNLVLKPVERMVYKVRTIADDPLKALQMADVDFEMEEMKKYKTFKQRSRTRAARIQAKWDRCVKAITPASSRTETMETIVLEKTIIKLGSLLALGFGEAGANIVSHNMRGLDSSGVNAMIPGSRVECIIGNARIRDFSFATEVLQARVMKFVNQIAEVVHGIVNEFHGAANKNMGDTFLIIWRTAGLEPVFRERLADLSLIAFAHILGCVHESPTLAHYRGHPGLQQRLGSRFRVNLSFGLHSGWAIEGAVGSEFKIDPSYLSPNVNITGALEEATRTYGVSLLTSEAVRDQCSPSLAQKCRLVDRVIIKGSPEPLDLYALDLDVSGLQVILPTAKISWNTRQRFRARQMLEVVKQERVALNVDVVMRLFEYSPQVATMRVRYTEEFLEVFKMGFRNYEEGEWQTARRFLKRTQDMLGIKDGPSSYLLQYMGADHDFEAPANWRGVHPLEV